MTVCTFLNFFLFLIFFFFISKRLLQWTYEKNSQASKKFTSFYDYALILKQNERIRVSEIHDGCEWLSIFPGRQLAWLATPSSYENFLKHMCSIACISMEIKILFINRFSVDFYTNFRSTAISFRIPKRFFCTWLCNFWDFRSGGI